MHSNQNIVDKMLTLMDLTRGILQKQKRDASPTDTNTELGSPAFTSGKANLDLRENIRAIDKELKKQDVLAGKLIEEKGKYLKQMEMKSKDQEKTLELNNKIKHWEIQK